MNQTNNNIQEFQIKTVINDVEQKLDKNNNFYYRVCAKWNNNIQFFYAFENDFSLKENTLIRLANSPEQLINKEATIIFEEKLNKDGNGTYCKIKEIENISSSSQ